MQASVPATVPLRRRARFIGLLAGLVAGILNSIIARVLMRVIALLAFGQGSFSIAGTAIIFMFGVLVGPLFGLIYRSTLYELRAHGLVKGLLFGLILVVTLQIPGLYIAPEFMAELMVIGPLGFAVFAVMNFAFVLSLAALTAWLERVWPLDDSRKTVEDSLTAVFGLLAVAGMGLLVIEIVGRLLGVVG